MNLKENFRHVANMFVSAISSVWAFLLSVTLFIVWVGIGFWSGFSESWQAILHIFLAIVTFFMVLFIQHSQHRETRSIQIKLDELLKGVEGSRNAFVNIQKQPDHQLDKLQDESEQVGNKIEKV